MAFGVVECGVGSFEVEKEGAFVQISVGNRTVLCIGQSFKGLFVTIWMF